MSVDLNQNLFDDVTISSLIKEIHENRIEKDTEIKALVSKVSTNLTADNVVFIGPTINSCVSASIKNDEHLIKLLSVVQKLLSTNNAIENGTGSFTGSSSETEELIANAIKTLNELNNEVKTLEVESPEIEDSAPNDYYNLEVDYKKEMNI